MEHTPGPWHVWKGDVAILIQNQATPSLPDNIANVYRRDPNGNEPRPFEANAHLIAAAPDLLAACEKALSFWERYVDRVGPTDSWAVAVRDALRAAIKKAREG